MSAPLSAGILDQLQRASGLLHAGQHAQARELLVQAVRANPDSFEAHRLLAATLLHAGESVRAGKELRACLRLRPGDVESSLLLAQTLVSSGQVTAAVAALREAWQQRTRDARLICALARALLGAGRADEALRIVEQTPPDDAPAEYWMLLGHLRMLAKQPEGAADAFREWTRLEPANADARSRLAAALADAQRAEDAEIEIRRCIELGARTPEVSFVLARALMGQARFAEAEAVLRDVIRIQPSHLTAQDNLAELVWMRTGDAGLACAEIDRVLHGQPGFHALRIGKARLLLSARHPDEALAVIEAGLQLSGEKGALLTAAATVALETGSPRALDYAERAYRAAPSSRTALVELGNASLAAGDCARSLEIAGRLRASDPADGRALAMQADAMRMLGDERYRLLLDYRSLVRAEMLDVPPGWPDLSTYVADLHVAMERAHVLRAHPIGNSLRQGSQVELTPRRSQDAAIAAFPQAIDGPIRRYMQALGAGDDPMRRRSAAGYAISGMWSVRLRAHGFHVNHYHPQGWISSACYLHLPSTEGGQGWLKFGEPAFPTDPVLPPEYFIKPEPGLLALFPSYMWHGTVPFPGGRDDSRLTIAFDVVPQA